MAKTLTFTTDAIAPDEPITVQSYCRRVTVFENDRAGTSDYTLRRPTASDAAIIKAAGEKTEFNGYFKPGDVIGFISAVSGSMTMAQEED